MNVVEKSGRCLFVLLAGLAGVLALQLVMSRFHDPAVARKIVLRVVWILLYGVAAFGVAFWKTWAYPLAIVVCVASLFYGAKGLAASSHPAVDLTALALWLCCLTWLWLPDVRAKFKPLTP
jgi:hypothetical protein